MAGIVRINVAVPTRAIIISHNIQACIFLDRNAGTITFFCYIL